MKVPSTSTPEILICVNACTEEVQKCRQIAAINTVILTDSQNDETSEGSGEPVSQGVTLIAKEDLEQEHLPIQGTNWSVVPCSRDNPGYAHSSFSQKKTAWFTRHNGKLERDGHGEDTTGLFEKTART